MPIKSTRYAHEYCVNITAGNEQLPCLVSNIQKSVLEHHRKVRYKMKYR